MKRTGLRRISCPDCEVSAYSTVAALERGPLPCCPDHGPLLPDDLELAHHVLESADLERHPGLHEYQRALDSAMHGQAPAYRNRAFRRPGAKPLRDPSEIAAERVAESLRTIARARQLSGLRQFAQAPEIPF